MKSQICVFTVGKIAKISIVHIVENINGSDVIPVVDRWMRLCYRWLFHRQANPLQCHIRPSSRLRGQHGIQAVSPSPVWRLWYQWHCIEIIESNCESCDDEPHDDANFDDPYLGWLFPEWLVWLQRRRRLSLPSWRAISRSIIDGRSACLAYPWAWKFTHRSPPRSYSGHEKTAWWAAVGWIYHWYSDYMSIWDSSIIMMTMHVNMTVNPI